jgi:2,3-bisphosphoglycerate-independent phosphoglycerate mutase
VPFIFIDPKMEDLSAVTVREEGELTDISPTALHILGIPVPGVMTGTSLLRGYPPPDRNEKRKLFMLVVDGWGVGAKDEGDLIHQANTPVMDGLQRNYPSALLNASGEAVGLPPGTVGNSEAGHLHIGAGRKIYSDRVRVNRALADGSFFRNPAFLWAMEGAKKETKPLHLLGIVSFYSSHGSIDHLKALLRMAKDNGVTELYIHGHLGRRGERPESGGRYIQDIEAYTQELGTGRVVSVIGRHWALDREENWDRIEKTYHHLVDGLGEKVFEA